MTRSDFYVYLCAEVKGGVGGHAGFIKRSHPETAKKIAKIYGERFTTEDVYCFLHRMKPKTCAHPDCSSTAVFKYFKSGYLDYCSRKCALTDPIKAERAQQTMLEKTGGKYVHHSQIPEYREANSRLKKSREYNLQKAVRELERSGGAYTHPMQRSEVVAKVQRGRTKNTLKRSGGKYTHPNQLPENKENVRIGSSTAEAKEKRSSSYRINELLLSGGTRTNSSQRAEVRRKLSQTARDPDFQERKRQAELLRSNGKYTSAMQRPDVILKQQKSAKQRYVVSYKGAQWSVQGFEDSALKFLIDRCYVPPLALTVPEETFWYKKRLIGQRQIRSTYLPDFKLTDTRGRNWYIEIKSEWTANTDSRFAGILGINELAKTKSLVKRHDQSIILLVMGRPQGKKGSSPRTGIPKYYLISTPANSQFELRTDFERLFKFFEDRKSSWGY